MSQSLRAALAAAVAVVTVVAILVLFAGPLIDWVVGRGLARTHLLPLVEGDLALYRQCLAERGGSCSGDAGTALPQTRSADRVEPMKKGLGEAAAAAVTALPPGHPAHVAAGALDHDVLDELLGLHNVLRGHGTAAGGASTARLHLSLAGVTDFADRVLRSVKTGGWDALSEHLGTAVARSDPGDAGHGRLIADHRLAVYVAGYLAAYFRNGRFVAIDLEVDPVKAKADLAGELARHLPDACRAFAAALRLAGELETGKTVQTGNAAPGEQAENAAATTSDDCAGLAADLYRRFGGAAVADRTLVKVGQTGYVSRTGDYTAQLPAFTVDFEPLAAAGSRVRLTEDGRPARIDYTTLGNQVVRVVLEAIFDAHEGLPAVERATGLTLGEYALPAYDPTKSPVDQADFNEIQAIEQRIATGVGVVLNRLVRGLGPVSPNNEALEELLVTLIATTVHKATEKATWCFYACDLDRELEDQAKTVYNREAEHLELKLKLGS